jgi:hypothetical protein
VKLGRKRTLEVHKPRVAELVAEGMSARKVAEEIGIPLGSAFLLCREAKEIQAKNAEELATL